MPTYDYRCKSCGHEFELFQSMTSPVKRKCPACAKNALERLIGTGAGVIFKGSGFYETDYRSDSYRKAAEADKKSAEPAAEKASSGNSSDATGEKAASSNGSGDSKKSGDTGASQREKSAAPAKTDKSKKTPGTD